MFNIGDYVVRISYKRDILFRITYISPNQIARLKGVSYRVIADAPLSDLELADGMRYTVKEDSIINTVNNTVKEIIKEREKAAPKGETFHKIGKVLHVDGDAFYLNLCLKYYKLLDIPVIGEHVSESEQPKRIKYLLEKYSPEILVVTGHDSLNKNHKSIYDLTQYRNSAYFVETVKRARLTKTGTNNLIIFAGACQSYFEEILRAGADYAASPDRVLIHALDPVFIVERIAYCPFNTTLSIEDALKYTITKFKGLGGYEVLGKLRRGGPNIKNVEDTGKVEDTTLTEAKESDGIRKGEDKVKGKVQEKDTLFNDTLEEFEAKMKKTLREHPSIFKY